MTREWWEQFRHKYELRVSGIACGELYDIGHGKIGDVEAAAELDVAFETTFHEASHTLDDQIMATFNMAAARAKGKAGSQFCAVCSSPQNLLSVLDCT